MKTDVKPYRPQQPLTEERKEHFLRVLAETGVLSAAARAASVHSPKGALATFQNEIARNPTFAEAVEEAKAAFASKVCEAVTARGIDGWLEPQFSAKTGRQMVDSEGKPAFVRKYSDRALELATRNRYIFADGQFAQASRTESTIKHESSVPTLELTRADILMLSPINRRGLAAALREIAERRNESSEAIARQEAQLLEHQTEEATFDEIDSNSQREPWEDLE